MKMLGKAAPISMPSLSINRLSIVKTILLSMLAIVVLSGCNDDDAKSVDHYLAHENERDNVLDDCRADMTDALQNGDCLNASKAAEQSADDRRSDAWESGTNLGKPEL